jgi:SAM-dependent methyltransferase
LAAFEKLKDFYAQCRHRLDEDANKGILRFSPEEIEKGGRILFESLEQGGFATFIVPGRTGWDPESSYFDSVRKQARLGRKITRLFLLPHRHYLREARLRKHWQLDFESGINVKFAIIGSPSINLPLLPESLDFGIWDENIVCWIYKNSVSSINAAGAWVVTKRKEDLDLAKRLREILLEQQIIGATPGLTVDEFALEEPLSRSAPVMHALADFLCTGDHLNKHGCAWYHKAWQYLRLLDLVSTPTWHSAFYLDALSDGVKKGQSRKIFISGSADYSMLAYVLYTYNRISAKCNVTLLDMCETPLLLSQWYAANMRTRITTVKEDILRFNSPKKFDFIVTDAFLTRFNHIDKKKLLRKWRSILKHGGRIVTTVRLDPFVIPNKPKSSTAEQIQNFAKRAENLTEFWRDFVWLSPEEIGQLAREYAKQMISYPIRNKEDLENLFDESGLKLERYDEILTKGEMAGTTYAELVARI